MTRADIVKSLHNAQEAHKKWVDFGEDLYQNQHIDTVQTPLHCTECIFGKWFYAEKDNIKNIPGFKDIEVMHKEFHDLYQALYRNAFIAHNKPKGLFSNKKEHLEKKEYLLKDLNLLREKSIDLVKLLIHVEKTVSLMSDRLYERNKEKLSGFV